MPYESDVYLSRHVQVNNPDLSQHVDELSKLATPPGSPNLELYRSMLASVTRMAQSDRSRWDAKIMEQTLHEMEHAFDRLEHFKRRRKITVFGSARTPKDNPLYAQARSLGSALASMDLMVITGAGGGIMAAAHEGAGLEHSIGLNITLPYEQAANPTVSGTPNLLSFHFFFLRKLFFVKEADALVLFPGGFGTLDEALEVLTLIQTGKSPIVPVVLFDLPEGRFWPSTLTYLEEQLRDNGYIVPSDMKLMRLVHSVDDAVMEIRRFYSNFHSSRWLNETFVIRLNHDLNERAMQLINSEFTDLCDGGNFQLQGQCDSEQDEPEFCELTRLAFNFNGRNYGRLRELIDVLNEPNNWSTD
ncbi:LOG family protein [Ectopseudomonas mendocina]|uniref:AMP nucleosidase n=1 Tax=Ectopseudomonas mendocina TaxID=300 RepID=A0ABZ2RJQ7_ECTME